ncbi:MAG: DUF1350 family protein [Cyanophyceae cyanobacterium]
MSSSVIAWQEINGNWVLLPPRPIALIHFLGGAFIAAAPQFTYRWLLEHLADQGYAIIATPFVNTFDHWTIARDVFTEFEQTRDRLNRLGKLRRRSLPIYGLGHSMGCKLHLLLGSALATERAGNMFIAFNNFPATRAVPLMDQLSPLVQRMERNMQDGLGKGVNVSLPGELGQSISQSINQSVNQWLGSRRANNQNSSRRFNPISNNLEFDPTPDETFQLIEEKYHIRRNLIVKFKTDEIDQSRELYSIFFERFGNLSSIQLLAGNHLTPIGQEMDLPSSALSELGDRFNSISNLSNSFNSLGNWVKEEIVYRDLNRLLDELLLWLDPTLAR